MPVITVNGQKVTVDDSFMQLSPEQQDATVDEIARGMNTPSPSAETWAPPGVLAPIQYKLGPDGKPVGARPAVPQMVTDAWNAIQAPGRALQGEYNQVEIGPNGSVSPFDPRMVSDASALAGLVTPSSVASRAGPAAGSIMRQVATPEIDDLYAAKDAAYKTVDQLGAKYSQEAVDRLYGDMIRLASESNISPTRHPKAYSMLVDLQDRNRPHSLTELDQMRQEIRRDLLNGDDAEAHFGQKFIDAIDNFIENAGPSEISGVTGDTANWAIKTARQANTTLRKSETLQDALNRARLNAASSGSGGNIDNAIRQQLKIILNNPNKSRGFTKAELEQIDKIIMGDNKLQNTIRLIGKLSPSGNGLMAALGIGATAANPLLAAAPAIGLAAKSMADRATTGAAENLTRSVRTGGAQPLPRLPGPISSRASTMMLQQQLTQPRPQIEQLPNGNLRLNT